ncbi:MAG: sugar phosphate isomerase/epimerase [Rhizobium sp.]|nr:sugar phosphate isomerase/epimerase [Rhizobium sp.]
MKLAFNTWVYSSFPVWVPSYPLGDVIERIAAIGYDGIEIGAASPHAYPDYLNAERRREIRHTLEANGLALASMLPAPGGGPGFNAASPLPEERANTIDQYRKVVDLCADLGGSTVLYVAGWQVFGTSRAQAWAWSREALIQIADAAATRGVTIAIEPTSADSNLIDSCDDAMQLMTQVGKPNVKLMFDTYHVIYRNEVSTDYIKRMGKDLHHVHLADVNRAAPSDNGKADYRAIIKELRKQDFQGYVTMEIGFDRRAVEPDRIAREALEYIRPLMV